MPTAARFIIVPAPGHYGDRAYVYSSHATLEGARRAVGGSAALCIREGSLREGAAWLRVYEEAHPLAQ